MLYSNNPQNHVCPLWRSRKRIAGESHSPVAARLSGTRDHTASTLVMLDAVRRRADEFDVIHFHVDLLQYPLFRDLKHKCVTTMHGRLDIADCFPIYNAFPEMPLISISYSQREPMPRGVNWLANIYHGLGSSACSFHPDKGKYLAFLGRIAPEKRPDRAIEIAKRSGVPLKIAAKVDKVDEGYFRDTIVPLLNHPLIEFIGEIDDQEKCSFLGGALALLFPIDWPEPFGLVMIEAMSAGTPVIAWRNGSVSEVVDDGVSGWVVNSMDEAVASVAAVRNMGREEVRQRFEARFTAQSMARAYIESYEALVAKQTRPILKLVLETGERIRSQRRVVRSTLLPVRSEPRGSEH